MDATEFFSYTPLPPRKAKPPIVCEYQYTYPSEPSLFLCQFTKARCGPHGCYLHKFEERPLDPRIDQPLAGVPFHITFV